MTERSTDQIGPMARVLERSLAAAARAAFRHPIRTLALTALVTLAAWLEVRTLSIDTDLARLLPPTFQSVQDFEKLKERFGPIGYVLVLASDAEPAALKKFADDLAEKTRALPNISYVNHRRPDGFFRDHALYYLSAEELEVVVERVEERADYERRAANPLLVDLDDSEPPSVDLSDILEKYAGMKLAPLSGPARGDYYLDEEQRLIAVFIKPDLPAQDLHAAKETIEHVDAVIRGLGPASYGPTMKVRIGGRYKKYQEAQAVIGSDVGTTSAIALVGVILYLLFMFRRASPIVMLIAPLLVGLLCAYALAAVFFGGLNILTAFVAAVMLGLGVDHGIHLLHRYEHERSAGVAPELAIDRTFGLTGRGVIIAGSTTALGFAGVAVSEFRGFRELGILAAIGIVLTMATAAVVLPALFALRERFLPQPRRRASLSVVGRGLAIVPRAGPALFWAASLVLLALCIRAGDVGFEYDFAALDGAEVPAYALDAEADRLLGHRQTPIVVMSEPEDEASVAQALRSRVKERGGASTIDFVVSRTDLVPADQEAKRELILRLRKLAAQIDNETLNEMAAAEPFGRGDLPVEIQRQFDPKPGRTATGTVLAFPAIPLSDGKKVMEMAAEVREVPLPGGRTVSAVAESMILADVLEMIFSESGKIGVATALAVLLTLWVLIGRFLLALICLLPTAITVFATAGALPMLGIELNYLNIVILPILFGIAEDAGVHMVMRGVETQETVAEALRETFPPIVGSAVSTAIGFGALLFADHPGLRSFGMVALVGIALSLFVALVWLVGLLALRELRRRRLVAIGAWTRSGARAATDLATVFGAGFSALGPGTVGALAALPLGWALSRFAWPVHAALLVGFVLLSILIVRRYLVELSPDAGDHADPREVVIDEVAGVLITLAFVPWTAGWVVAAFVLFRILDMLKPGPIAVVERKLKGALGIVLDDVAAGLVGGVLLIAWRWVRM